MITYNPSVMLIYYIYHLSMTIIPHYIQKEIILKLTHNLYNPKITYQPYFCTLEADTFNLKYKNKKYVLENLNKNGISLISFLL